MLAMLGCSAPEACVGVASKWLEASTSEASFELAAGEPPKSFELEATVSNLPELWHDHTNLLDSEVSFDFTYEYVGEPKGSDGKTEMPRVVTNLSVAGKPSRFEDQTTSSFPGAGWSFGGSAALFQTDGHRRDLPGFCEYGVETCTLPVVVRFERLDGEPFPPLSITWKAEANVKVTPCPLEKEVRAELTLEPRSP